ncbi:Protein of unknown function DUF58 [Pseudoxanthomonas sp. GM95]|uniref:DUF58 domain-containing protein n=1 Tax=Pseudoxanthomonas sp. GM95 TaxID=1881043 RepID=UPI0008BAB65D|nr:DUF58 domain-containing protein [Pseudoxanthomonas sp. GM95]SEK74094.1 Protein of unknown function DUF58 [Pseudoxanthomonas sp. GM95]
MAAAFVQRLRARLALLARPRSPESLPVTLDRRRVYVLPTAFGMFAGVLVATMLLGALNYNNNPALLLALLLAATFMASLMASHLQLSGLRMTSVTAEPVHAGTPLQLQIALAAHDRRPRIGLRLRAGTHDVLVPPITDAAVVASVACPTTRRGWLQPERLRLSTTQPLGVALAWSWLWPETPLLVYPAVEIDGPPLPEPAGTSRQTRVDAAGEELHHLRAYRPGDPQHTIAWKPSARRDVLLVREYEQPVGIEVTLDWTLLAPLTHEARIRRLTHWIELAERQARRYRLRLPGHAPIGPALGPAHRHQCLRALALLPQGRT